MELWLVFGILGYLAFAISTSIDKFIMKYRIGAIRTDTFKMFFDGTVLLVIGLLFFDLEFTFSTFAWALLLGVFYGFQGILYFTLLEVRDAEDLIPNFQALRILLIFVGSIVIFSEPVSILNYFGVIVILGGIYTLVSEDGLKFPKFQKGSSLIILMTISNVIYSLLLKKLLFNFKPINLAIMMYFSTTLILLLYQVIFRKRPLRS
ncbi:hypothetical protein KY316_01300, partial [Candidatus Woesearchaeota archaeon]|nr:hypothetical protein [Candidatus Woesearchaeota archaeon]